MQQSKEDLTPFTIEIERLANVAILDKNFAQMIAIRSFIIKIKDQVWLSHLKTLQDVSNTVLEIGATNHTLQDSR